MPPSFRQRKRLPKPKDIATVLRVLTQAVPMETPPLQGWRESIKKVPNYRIESTTNGRNWMVDIYAGNYFVVTVGGGMTEPCKTISSLVGHLCRMLGVTK